MNTRKKLCTEHIVSVFRLQADLFSQIRFAGDRILQEEHDFQIRGSAQHVGDGLYRADLVV